MVFFSKAIEKEGITKSQIYYASSIRAFIGISVGGYCSMPAFVFVVSGGVLGMGNWFALAGSDSCSCL